jgi:O-methyltransferase
VHPLLAKRLSSALARHGWRVQRTIDGHPNPAHLWHDDEDFRTVMGGVSTRTLLHDAACYVLYGAVLSTATLPGEIAEVGVYRGGTALLLGRLAGGSSVHLFDTFTGLPPADPTRDLHQAGDFADTSAASVRELLGDLAHVHLHEGVFPQTAGPVLDERFRMVHVDVDLYQSVLDSCTFFYDRLVPGGVIVFDDYGWTSTPGARVAVDEFFAAKPERPIYLPTGQAIVCKHPEGS